MPRDLKTGWKRIGRSGPAVDGRVIKPEMIEQAAKNYNKDLFTALIWPEHFRFINLGTVEALRVQDNAEGGKDLFAQIAPNAFYLQANNAGQKLFTSMELTPDFRKTGEWYLTGLGATDDPASAATTEMRLSASAKPGVFYSHAVEHDDHSFTDSDKPGFMQRLAAALFSNHTEDEDMAEKAEIDALKKQVKELTDKFAAIKPPADDKDKKPDGDAEQFAKLIEQLDARYAKKPDDNKDKKTDVDKDKTQSTDDTFFDKLFGKLDERYGKKPDDKTDPKAELKSLQDQVVSLSKTLAAALKEKPGTDAGEHFGATGGIDPKSCL